jgi:N-6 DNA methylase
MTSHAEAIMQVANSLRGAEGATDVPELVRRCKDAGVPMGVGEVVFILQRIGRGHGEHYLPTEVAEFVATLLEPWSPRTLLDPWAGAGLLAIPLKDRLKPERFEAYSRDRGAREVFGSLDGAAGITIRDDEPLDALQQCGEHFDAVVGIPPLGARSQRPLAVRVGDEDRAVSDDYGFLLMLQSCLCLTENGVGVFIVPNSFFFASGQKGKARQTLEDLGVRLIAAIELPAGTFEPLTMISTHIVILKRGPAGKLFTAKYSPDAKQQKALLRNLGSRSDGKVASLGRLVDAQDFRGFSAVELAEKIREQARRMGFVAHAFRDVVLELNAPSSSKHWPGFEAKTNCVYLPQMAATPATASQESLPKRLKSYFQLVINPDVADAEFLAGVLNTPFGQLWRDSLRSGAYIPRISRRLLEESTFHLPRPDARKIQTRVVDCDQAIVRLRSELSELQAQLWRRPTEIGKTESALRTVNREDRFEDWLDTLPFPLASILWVCQAQGGSYREQYERKIHFFEALAEFLAVVHLSAFISNPAIWSQQKQKVAETLKKGSLSLEMSTFGAWKAVAGALSAEARRLLGKEPEVCFELYRTRDRDVLESITSKRIVSVIQTANAIRNRWSGHAGAVRDADARAVNDELTRHIETVRRTFGTVWEVYELYLPGECKIKSGLYHYAARKVMGSRTPFPPATLDLVEAMEDGHLHLKSPHEDRALKLLPLVKVMPSPRTEENACYFYNRRQNDGIRFLSYHFDPDAEMVDEFADTAAALKSLTLG